MHRCTRVVRGVEKKGKQRGERGGGGLNNEGGHLVRNFKGRWWDRHLERQRDTKGQRSDVADC